MNSPHYGRRLDGSNPPQSLAPSHDAHGALPSIEKCFYVLQNLYIYYFLYSNFVWYEILFFKRFYLIQI